jgi:hypothetical protein
MLINQVRKGAEILFKDGRKGIMMDNARGITRVIEVQVLGQCPDIGSCYVDEIYSADGEVVTLSEGQIKKLNMVRGLW